MTESILLTINEACETLKLGRTALYALLQREVIESIHIGRRRLVPREALEVFVARERERQAGDRDVK